MKKQINRRSKGMRLERLVEKKLIQQGHITYRVKGTTKFNPSVDIFSLFDLISIDSILKNKHYHQVKTQKPNLKIFEEFKKEWLKPYDVVMIWVWKGKDNFEVIEI